MRFTAHHLWRWVLLSLVRSPLTATLWILLLAGVPVLEGIRPLPSSEGTLDVLLAWSLPLALLGSSLGLARMSHGQGFLVRLAPGTRWAGELGALALAAAYLQLPILAGSLLCGAAPSDLGRALPAILTLDLHLAGLAQLFLLPPLSTASRVTAFLAGAWVLPALVAPCAPLARILAPLDAGLALRSGGPASGVALASALALAGFLLRTPPAPERLA